MGPDVSTTQGSYALDESQPWSQEENTRLHKSNCASPIPKLIWTIKEINNAVKSNLLFISSISPWISMIFNWFPAEIIVKIGCQSRNIFLCAFAMHK